MKLNTIILAATALAAATSASAADSHDWSRTQQRIDRAERAIRSLDTAARLAAKSKRLDVKAMGRTYLAGRRIGSALVGGRDRPRH